MTNMFREEIESQLANLIIDSEFSTAKKNKEQEDVDFESYIDLLDSVREPKEYDWMSDLRIPEFIAHVLTQASIDANQYFRTRDFAEAYLEDGSDEALACAAASTELINRTLNQKHLHYYQKYMRGKILNNVVGRVYARCWWEKKTRRMVVGQREVTKEKFDERTGMPVLYQDFENVERDVPIIDRFNFEILDNRNVFTDNKYTYSIQEKDYVFIRSEHPLHRIKEDAVAMEYFNLDQLEDAAKFDTETARSTYNSGDRDPKHETASGNPFTYFDVIERYGKYWVKVEGSDGEDNPVNVSPGIDEYGKPLPEAELVECIITWAVKESTRVLIGFRPTPYYDALGTPYRPLLRGLCYIHPISDGGMGDGKHVRELQLAIDDTFNISNDRVKLATLPVLKTKRYEAEDNPEIYIEPGHNIPLENPTEDLVELRISDNIQGAMTQLGLLFNKMQQIDATFPTTMGDVPGMASTTATAVAGAAERTDVRANYKAMTFESTFLNELYWMVQHMTWQYAHPETGEKLMGDKVVNFNPVKDYYYKPLSQSIETEYSKANKIKFLIQVFGYVVAVPHPDTIKVANMLLVKMLEFMGDEFSNFADKLFNPEKPMTPQGQGGGQEQPGASGMGAASNQNGVPMSTQEQMARMGMGG